jgi:ATP-dependent Lon protease
VLIPDENTKDLAEIPQNIKDSLEIIPVKWIDEVLKLALKGTPEPLPQTVAEAVIAPSDKADARRAGKRAAKQAPAH